jgi:serine protease
VLDTGVQANHPDLAGQVLAGRSFLSQGQQSTSTVDGNGHGTHVAGIVAAATNTTGIAGVAPGAKVLPVKVLSDDGSGWLSDVAAGLTWAVDNGAKVANLSLGGTVPSGVLHVALVDAMQRGTLVVVAAGNSGPCAPASYPAAYPEVLSVASTDQSRRASSFSTTGSYVDIAAPGSAIVSTWPTTLVASGYQYASGTSMASPHVAAAAAVVWAAKPGYSVTQVRSALQSSATDLMVPGRDQWTGSGLVNLPGALQR